MSVKMLSVALLSVTLSVNVFQTSQSAAQENTDTETKQSKTGPESEPASASQKKRGQAKEISRLVRQANTAHTTGDYDEGYTAITKACELAPDIYSYHLARGDISFAAGKIAESIKAYDDAIQLQPVLEPRLWQRGLAHYYAGRFADGVRQFETHQTVNSQDVENAVWHLLCASRVSDVDVARKKLIPINGDTRIPMSHIYEMFAGRMTPEKVLQKAQKTTERVEEGSVQHRLQLYYAHLYTGLYHEMLKDNEAAITSLRKAEEVNPLGKSNFMGQVARVHLMVRGKLEAKTDE